MFAGFTTSAHLTGQEASVLLLILPLELDEGSAHAPFISAFSSSNSLRIILAGQVCISQHVCYISDTIQSLHGLGKRIFDRHPCN